MCTTLPSFPNEGARWHSWDYNNADMYFIPNNASHYKLMFYTPNRYTTKKTANRFSTIGCKICIIFISYTFYLYSTPLAGC